MIISHKYLITQQFILLQDKIQEEFINYDDFVIVKRNKLEEPVPESVINGVITVSEETRREIERKVSNFLNESLMEMEKQASFMILVEPSDDPAIVM